jgi:hypothetical protein
LKSTIASAILLSLLASASLAQTAPTVAPLFSAKRASLATGAQYEWRTTPLANNSEPLLGRHAEWAAGVFGAYNLTPHASLVGSTTIGIDSKQFRHTLGLRIRIWRGDK